MPELHILTTANRAHVLRAAAARLADGAIAVIPTDTVYGLAAHPGHTAAVARLGAIKGRAANKPVAMLAADMAAVLRAGALFPPVAARLAAAHWPGGLTLVLQCGDTMEGFRVPDHPFCRDLLAACGGILRVTSANLSGRMPALTAARSLADVGLDADLVIDDGPSPGGMASTVVRVSAAETTILRAGAVKEAALAL